MPDAAAYDRLATLLEPVDEELVHRLAPAEDERWLDLVTGTGAVALRAARAGAAVTAVDGSAPILEKVASDAREEGLELETAVADPEYLPFEDASFDVVASRFGLVYVPDHANVAAELARVARAGARLGFTAWRPNPKLGELYRRFTDEPIDGLEAYEWGREDHVEDMLGEDFELDFADGTVSIDASSGEELWQLLSIAPAPRDVLRRLDEQGAQEFRHAFVDLYEEYRSDDGIRVPRRYLLVLGRRR
jgi:SAM-dependent methyltransferase